MRHETNPRPQIAVSACLLGQDVRYDGGNKRDPFLDDQLRRHAELIPVCPEVELGLGIPRPPIGLRETDGQVTLQVLESCEDLTQPMNDLAMRLTADFARVDGFILKSKSPSCGLSDVKLHRGTEVLRTGRGVFAATVRRELPDVPASDERDLADASLRWWFLARVFVHCRLKSFLSKDWACGELIAFHSKEKYLLMSLDEAAYRRAGPIVAVCGKDNQEQTATAYQACWLSALQREYSVGQQRNALQHLQGYFRDQSPSVRERIQQAVTNFSDGASSLADVVAILRDAATNMDNAYLKQQSLLMPFPTELMSTQ